MERIKIILATIALILLSGCNLHYHVQKSLKHKEKAIQKGAVFNDSIEYKYKFRTDTILDTLTNETILYKYVVDSIPFVVTKSVYVPLSRQERLALRDSTKYALRTLKNQNKKSLDSLDYLLRIEKQKQKTARS